MADTRASLILRLRSADDAAAWHEFVEIYQPVIQRIARRKGLQDADARDVTQTVLSRIAQVVNRWDPDPAKGTFRGWLFRITHNLVVQFLRERSRNPAAAAAQMAWNDVDWSAIAASDSAESRIFLLERERQLFLWSAQRIRREIEPRTWEVFWRTAVLNEPISQVASDLSLRRGTIYVIRSRVMARLRELVREVEFSESRDLPFPPRHEESL